MEIQYFFITRLILALIAQIQSKAAVLPSAAPEVDVYSLPQPIPRLKARETTAICIALGPDEVSSAMKGTAMELGAQRSAWTQRGLGTKPCCTRTQFQPHSGCLPRAWPCILRGIPWHCSPGAASAMGALPPERRGRPDDALRAVLSPPSAEALRDAPLPHCCSWNELYSVQTARPRVKMSSAHPPTAVGCRCTARSAIRAVRSPPVRCALRSGRGGVDGRPQ